MLTSEETLSLVAETGYRRPLGTLALQFCDELSMALRQYYTVVRGQVELCQFVDVLKTYGVLDLIREHPELMKPLLVLEKHELTKG